MSDVRGFFWNSRVGWTALIVFLGAALPSARADVITGTDSGPAQTPVSILVDFFNVQDGVGVPLGLTSSNTTVNLTIPSGPGIYGIQFAMKAGNSFLSIPQVVSDLPNAPSPGFSFTPTVGGQTYTIAGSLTTSNLLDQNSWFAVAAPGSQGFPQVGEFFFTAAGAATGNTTTLSFSVDDPNGKPISFTDPNAVALGSASPEPASLALAGLGLVGLAGYGWRRRFAV